MNRRGELGDGEKRAAVATDRQHRHVAPRMRDPQCGGKAIAECSLIACRDEAARMVARESEARDISGLCQLVDEDAVTRERITDCAEPFQLSAKFLSILGRTPCLGIGRAFGPVRVRVGNAVHCVDQQGQGIGKPRMDADIDWRAAPDLRLVDIDMDDLHCIVMAPCHDLALQACAEADHQIDIGPQAVRDRHAD